MIGGSHGLPSGADVATAPATTLAALIADRRLSPVELLDAVLDRIDRVAAPLNAFAALDREGARRAAADAEAALRCSAAPGPLHGVPVTVKDVQAVRGLPTRRGSRLTDPAPAAADAPAVARLRAAGAVILGKTTTTEHGWTAVSDSPLTGTTHNPWRHGLTAGGSSSGAAALAAAGCGPLHLGTDGAGSVRLPAHFCGVVGFKPTFGTVPYVPVPNNGALSHIGPITRTVADAALMLSVMSGFHPADPTTHAQRFDPARPGRDPARVRIAFSPDLGHARVDPGVARVQPKPQMVETWTDDPGGLLWRFTLRAEQRFSDGGPVTAKDAVAFLKRWAVRAGRPADDGFHPIRLLERRAFL